MRGTMRLQGEGLALLMLHWFKAPITLLDEEEDHVHDEHGREVDEEEEAGGDDVDAGRADDAVDGEVEGERDGDDVDGAHDGGDVCGGVVGEDDGGEDDGDEEGPGSRPPW